MTAPSLQKPSEPQKAARPRRTGRKIVKILLWLFVPLLSATAGVTVWLVTTESGLRFALYRLPALGGVEISSRTLHGTLWRGFDGEGWQIRTDAADISLTKFRFAWQPQRLSEGLLHIRELAAGDIHITPKPTPPKESAPLSLPESISLPLAVRLDRASFGRVSVGKGKNIYLQGGEFSYGYDHVRHRLTVGNLQSPWSGNSGELMLETASPFALSGKLEGGGELDGIYADGDILLSGNLQDTVIKAGLHGGKVSLNAYASVSLFENSLDRQIGQVQVKGAGLNLADFLPGAPQTDLDFDTTVIPSAQKGLALEGSIDLANNRAAAADQNGIPVRSILSDFTVSDRGVLSIADASVGLLGQGRILLGGSVDTQQDSLNLSAELDKLTPGDLVKSQYGGSIGGVIRLTGSYGQPRAVWALRGKNAQSNGEVILDTDSRNGQRTINVVRADILPEGGGSMNANGRIELFNQRRLQFAVDSRHFNPARLHADFPSGDINGSIRLDGELEAKKFGGRLKLGGSSLSGVVLGGSADLQYEGGHLSRADAEILLGRNRLKTAGSLGKAGDRLAVDINAPELDKFGFGLGGSLNAKGYVAGDPAKIETNLSGSARGLRFRQAVNLRELDFRAALSPDYARPLNLQLSGRELVIPGSSPTRIDTVSLNVAGTGLRHSIRGGGSMALGGKNYTLDLAADGGLNNENQWKGSIGTLDLGGGFHLKLQNRMALEAGAQRVVMGSARWAAMGGRLNMDSFVWDRQSGLSSKGSANGLNIAELHQFFTLPVEHDLILAADWDVAYSQNTRGYLNVRQQSGDVVLPYRRQALGLNGLLLQTRFQNGRIDSSLKGGTRYGDLEGGVTVSQQFGSAVAQAPVSGHLRLNIPDLSILKNLLPVGQSARGSLQAEASIGGRIGEPLLGGTLNGDNLYYINRDLGVILDNGSLRSRLSGQQWLIESLRFARGNGSVILKGSVAFGQGTPVVDADAVFDKYEMLDKPRRHLTLSGNGHILYSDKGGITLNGSMKVDEGRFGFQKSGMPSLDDDVTVLGDTKPPSTTVTPISMNLTLDLNNSVFFKGEGVDVSLGGKLQLTAQPKQDIQAVGTVSVIKGKYKAYGQDLNITKGSVSFVGPLTDPNLNIRAVRNQSAVGAGVEVVGSISSPRVTLVANEAMSEKDKLSWLILNRASSGSDGDEAALATAAGAFLGGKVNNKLGLVDDFGMTSQRSRNTQTGELNPAEQVLTVGKQLTGELYAGYEYGLNSASQTVKLVYQLSSTIQAIARVGTRSSGGELKYVIRFD
ncbi:MAG: translocation/assembly module TamB domain-containing protein [Neisseria sp.]|nr:translocation/assembly module TamB domain-containing protein [Neisseria sp.]